MEWDRLWAINRRGTRFYIRFYPNPGFMVRIWKWEIKWSRHYGWSKRRVG